MNETTDQMSLLDAIGFSAPEETKKQKKAAPAKAGKPSAKTSEAAPEKKAAKTGKVSRAKAKPEAEAVLPEKEAERAAEDVTASAEPAPEASTPQETDAAPADGTSEPITLDRHLCFALYSANHAMNGVYKALLKEIGLTYPQFLAMTVLWETNNVPVGAITSKLQLDTNTLTPLLKRLEVMGLLTRTRNIKDERQVILKLTRKGRALQKKTEHFSGCILSSTGLELDELVDLQGRIMKLRDNLRKAGLD